VTGWIDAVSAGEVVVLLAGFGYAAVSDVRTREVSDRLWQLLSIVGLGGGAIVIGGGGPVGLALWLVVGFVTAEHMFPWDERLVGPLKTHADALELALYLAAILTVATAAARFGLGPAGVPVAVVAVLATVLISRVLFEAGVLYGGADAKALMAAGLLVPLFPSPFLAPAAAFLILAIVPFSLTLLTNAALFSAAVPLALAIRNLQRGEFTFPRGFTGYSIAVVELPHRFVWVRDPAADGIPSAEDAETSAEDARLRSEAARALHAKGVSRVWVTPQLPFLVLMAAGTFAAIVFGNLLLDAVALA
jgi:archaeal preflagellin peptidase FlaK